MHAQTFSRFARLAIVVVIVLFAFSPRASAQCYKRDFENCCLHRSAVVPCFECGETVCCPIYRFDLTYSTWVVKEYSSGFTADSFQYMSLGDCHYMPATCDSEHFDPPCCVYISQIATVACHTDDTSHPMVECNP